jgi:hypothetical protein
LVTRGAWSVYRQGMQRVLALIFVCVACGGTDPDPHALGTCTGWSINGGMPFTGQCEFACAMPPPANGTKCDTFKVPQCSSFDFNGTSGCCFPETAAGPIRFYPCF